MSNPSAASVDADILAELNEWGPVFTLWSNSEGKLGGALSGVAKAVEKCYVALQEHVSVNVSLCYIMLPTANQLY